MRPDLGGHSTSTEMLLIFIFAGSQSPSKAHAVTIFPPFSVIESRSERKGLETGNPVSSWRFTFRRQASKGGSPFEVFAFRDGPYPQVLFRKVWATRVNEEDLKSVDTAIHDQACVSSGHEG